MYGAERSQIGNLLGGGISKAFGKLIHPILSSSNLLIGKLTSRKVIKQRPIKRSPRRVHSPSMPSVYIEQVEFTLIPYELDVRVIKSTARVICKSDNQHDYFTTEGMFNYPDLKLYYGPSTLVNILDFKEMVVHLNNQKQPLKTPCLVIRSKNNQSLNAVFLCAAYLNLFKKMSIDESMEAIGPILGELSLKHYKTEGDQRADDLQITIRTCLEGLADFIGLKLLKLDQIDIEEVKMRENPAHGDMNWIVPGKILALAGPEDDGYPIEEFADYAEAHNVGAVFRLNAPLYHAAALHHQGISHFEMFMEDGGIPTLTQVEQFYDIADECWEANVAIAVHCMAGLGRTGTMIATFLIKKFGLRADRVIAYLRVMRPGCILGMQARFLDSIQYLIRGEPTPDESLAYLINYPKEYLTAAMAFNSGLSSQQNSLSDVSVSIEQLDFENNRKGPVVKAQ